MSEAKSKKFKMSLTNQIMLATAAGIVFGLIVGPWCANLKVIGDIFLRLVQQCVVALIMSAVAVAVSNPENSGAGKMGLHTFKWIFIFTIISAVIGLFLGNIIQPGAGITFTVGEEVAASTIANASLSETLLGFVSTNVFGSMATSATVPCIVFSLFFGVATGIYTKQSGSTIIYDVIKGFNEVIMHIIKLVMNVAPIGIFCLLANVTGAIGIAVIFPMVKFLGALLLGVLIELFLYCVFVSVKCKINLFKMPKKFYKMSMIALTTTSSAITLPTKMEDMVTKFGVSRRIADFTGPITMAMNSSGGVTCYVLAILFMAQSSGVVLSGKELIMAILFSCLMCMGTIVVPGGVIITYTFLATSMGLAPESFIVLVGIDWFSGMFRTLNNVDVDVLLGLLVADKLGELDRDVYNEKKIVAYD
ncbi:dicarboxylate/amino acid:cation symporter [Clostridium sp. AM58-1XD]|uniref:dicarboxylate/amino acid:cation symporter n=1 Tax=Clostridium sp. AM58-1XD TaxID=2292307 RepID=UPI000E4AD980|nr:dicarboxylate/amino acid:cation symporter [Clostridium sp. AM58-1XD]RGZ00411.1 dicarboxylate/amino acid:cation symporter [Clostridium sp. AM58-1XD]